MRWPVPVSAVDLPFREQAEFFRRKLNLPTEAWTDIYSREHDWAFVVAGANRDALVSDFRTAEEKVVANGDRKSTRLNSSHVAISYAVFCLKKKNQRAETKENNLDIVHYTYSSVKDRYMNVESHLK